MIYFLRVFLLSNDPITSRSCPKTYHAFPHGQANRLDSVNKAQLFPLFSGKACLCCQDVRDTSLPSFLGYLQSCQQALCSQTDPYAWKAIYESLETRTQWGCDLDIV